MKLMSCTLESNCNQKARNKDLWSETMTIELITLFLGKKNNYAIYKVKSSKTIISPAKSIHLPHFRKIVAQRETLKPSHHL